MYSLGEAFFIKYKKDVNKQLLAKFIRPDYSVVTATAVDCRAN